MKGGSIGVFTSLAVHLCMLPVFAGIFTLAYDKSTRVIAVDFSLVDGKTGQEKVLPGPGNDAKELHLKAVAPGPKQAVKKSEERAEKAAKTEAAAFVTEQVSPLTAPQTVTASDPNGQTVVHGIAANGIDHHTGIGHNGAGGTEGAAEHGEQGGSGSGTRTSLPGSADYEYIRNAVMKNIRYPARARKMGYEGKTVVSFIVLENGETCDIKVIKSSGRKLLDENAFEGIAKTVIPRKAPYKVAVLLPVVYKLNGGEEDL